MQMLDEKTGASLPVGTLVGWFGRQRQIYFGVIKERAGGRVKIEANINGQKSSHLLFQWEKYFHATPEISMLAILEN